jgi:hypothetical protein
MATRSRTAAPEAAAEQPREAYPARIAEANRPASRPATGVSAASRAVCAYCGKRDPDPEWGVLWSKRLGAHCCFRCYQARAR